jgi:ABC-type dipeptide/oligopeptide/nickel transport system permease component
MKRLLRRLLVMLPVLFALVTFTFILTHVAGGDPAVQIAGPQASQSAIDHIKVELGLNKPLLDQYVTYLGHTVRLDFGHSLLTNQSVWSALMTRIGPTLEVIVLGMLMAVILGMGFGSLAAWARGRWPDRGIRGVSFLLLALPDFWIGLLLVFFFYYKLGWFPAPTGQLSALDPQPTVITHAALVDSLITGNWAAFGPAFSHAVLPVVTVGLLFSAPIARLTRSSMVEVLDSDYVRFAQSVGLRRAQVTRYVMRAAVAPVVTYVGIYITVLVGGMVLIEQVFSWGGAAQFVAQSAAQSDYPVVQGFVLLAGVFSVIVFLIVDLLLQAIDPRVRLDS